MKTPGVYSNLVFLRKYSNNIKLSDFIITSISVPSVAELLIDIEPSFDAAKLQLANVSAMVPTNAYYK